MLSNAFGLALVICGFRRSNQDVQDLWLYRSVVTSQPPYALADLWIYRPIDLLASLSLCCLQTCPKRRHLLSMMKLGMFFVTFFVQWFVWHLNRTSSTQYPPGLFPVEGIYYVSLTLGSGLHTTVVWIILPLCFLPSCHLLPICWSILCREMWIDLAVFVFHCLSSVLPFNDSTSFVLQICPTYAP